MYVFQTSLPGVLFRGGVQSAKPVPALAQRELADALAAEGFSEREFRLAKDAYDRALGALREAELALVEARGELARAESDVREAGRRAVETGGLLRLETTIVDAGYIHYAHRRPRDHLTSPTS